ncbi:TPA: Asp-tRNA(Asn)/Glu-tRNA(Gln) amidotransferase GatCAB subunit C [Patescibacteria group bacterium]|nr:Asp-tRNA(Asn)/Glu-tRNA(Gln) amidotransferase GatCAB subunit C [Patescibacteria group bacterium]
MKIDSSFLKHIAELSRIKLSKKELRKFTPQMRTILESVKVLKEVDTTNVEPMKKHVPFSDLREDTAGKSIEQEDVLSNVKHMENGMVKVYGEVFGGIEES